MLLRLLVQAAIDGVWSSRKPELLTKHFFFFTKRKLNPYRVFGVVGQSPTVLKEKHQCKSVLICVLRRQLHVIYNKLKEEKVLIVTFTMVLWIYKHYQYDGYVDEIVTRVLPRSTQN